MPFTAAQVREARELLGWTQTVFSRRVPTSLDKVTRAQDDERISTLSDLDLRAICMSLQRSGVELRADGSVRLRGMP